MLKSYGWWWWVGVGGPCDFSVSPSPFGLDFGTLDFGTSDSGLTKIYIFFLCINASYNWSPNAIVLCILFVIKT